MELQSYKPYARFVTIISAIIVALASLDASQVIHLFPQYATQINTILMIAGLIAPAIAQEKRVVRAEELVINDLDTSSSDENVVVNLTLDGENVIDGSTDEEDTVDENDVA